MPKPLPNEWGVEPCLDLINTRWSDHLGSGIVHDRLPLPIWRRAFLEHWGFKIADPDDQRAWARLARMRGVLRDALELNISGRRLTRALRSALEKEINRSRLILRIEAAAGGETLVLQRSGDPWAAVTSDIATSAMRLIGESRRVKVCANPNCTWMFVDESKSGSRRWCDVSICGSLINVRRHRNPAASRRRASE